MKRLLVFLAIFACPALCWGQQTSVNATILDPAGHAYQFLTGSASINCPGNAQPTFNGFTVPRNYPITGGDGNGHFTLVLFDVNQIAPLGCSYNFAITAQNGSTSFTATSIGAGSSATPIAGAGPINLSTPINAYAVLLPSTGGSGPALQTNSITNANQTLLNLKNGTNVTLTPDGSGGVTVNSTASGSTSTDNIWTSNNRFGGIDPWADITAFGAKPEAPLAQQETVVTATSGSPIITVAPANFSNGDGITILQAGATNTMSTPAAPIVAPEVALAETTTQGSYITTIAGTTGSSTYKYATFGIDQHGGVTAISPTTTITNGMSTLGLKQNSVTSVSLSNNTVTFTTTGTQNLVAGQLIHYNSSTNAQFSQWWNVSTVNNAGHTFTVTGIGLDTRAGSPSSATGGTISYYNGNYVQFSASPPAQPLWKYGICAQRPGDGSMHIIGISGVSGQTGGQYRDYVFMDYGATVTASQNYPWWNYWTDSLCTNATPINDYLTTTVLSGGGTGTLTLATNSLQTPGIGILGVYDAAPAILAAANSISWNGPSYNGGSVWIPPVPASGARLCYIINSYLKLPANTKILQAGALCLGDTLELSSPTQWDGGFVASNNPAFAWNGGAEVTVYQANPGIYTNQMSGSNIKNLTFDTANANGGVIWLGDDGYQITWDSDSFTTNQAGSGDYLGTAMILRTTSTGGNVYNFNNSSFTGGPNQVTDSSWAPLLYLPQGEVTVNGGVQNKSEFIHMNNTYFSRRSIADDAYGGTLGEWDVNWMYRQGGITPLFMTYNGSGSTYLGLNLMNSKQDTETSGTVALLGLPGNITQSYLNFMKVNNDSIETGGAPPAITGMAPIDAVIMQSGIAGPVLNVAYLSSGLRSTFFQALPTIVSQLPAAAAGNAGQVRQVTDSTTVSTEGQTCVGSGAVAALAFSNGTVWKCF
jgi:hypothetical protein